MRAILVDDEKLALDLLERQIQKISDITIVNTSTRFNIENKKHLLQTVDIVFLDIEMPGMNGLQLAEKIVEINPNIIIVFVTAFNHYAVEAFELNALDYILKPVNGERLKITIDRVKKSIVSTKKQTLPKYHQLRVNVCRELNFILNNKTSHPVHWRTARAKELFLYLLHNHGNIVRKIDIIDLLWTDYNVDKAYAQLYTAIYHIRNALKVFSDHFVIKSVSDGYTLEIYDTTIDIKEWETKLHTLPPLTEQSIEQYEKVMDYYTGGYLEEEDYIWIEQERYRLERLWSKVAHDIVDFHFQQNNIEQAEVWLIKISTFIPDDEIAHFRLMKIYDSLGYGVLVNHQYELLKTTMENLDLTVSQDIESWFKSLKNN